MTALRFTSSQLLLIYGLCEVEEEQIAVETEAGERAKAWESTAQGLHRLNDCRRIMMAIAEELSLRGEELQLRPGSKPS